MPVRIERTFQVREPVEKVWKLLSDPASVVTCVPGAQLTEKVDDRNFKGAVSVKVGPSVTDYKGEVRIERLDEQAHEIELVGKGLDVRGRGSASMKMTGKLRSLPNGVTEVAAISEVNVVGTLAQFGSRMIQDVSDFMFGEFVRRFQQQLQQTLSPAGDAAPVTEPPPTLPPAKPVNALSLLFAVLVSSIGRIVARILGRAHQT